MYSHNMVGSNDIARSKAFYDALFTANGGKPGAGGNIDTSGGTGAGGGSGVRVGGGVAGASAGAWRRDPGCPSLAQVDSGAGARFKGKSAAVAARRSGGAGIGCREDRSPCRS